MKKCINIVTSNLLVLLLLVIITSIIGTVGVQSLQAQGTSAVSGTTPVDIAISPPVTYFQIEPGQKKTFTITIEQKGNLQVEITPSLVDFTSDGKTGQPVLGDSSEFRYLKLTLPKNTTPDVNNDSSSFILEPNKRKNIQVTLDIPSNAAEGEFPLTLLFRAKPAAAAYTINTGTGGEVNAVIGSNLIVLISPTDRDRGNLVLENIKTLKIIDSFMPISFTLSAKNNGKNATTASGSAEIKNWQNTVLREFPIYPDMVLAKTTRNIRTADSISASLDDPSLISDVFSYRPTFALGPYTITATLEKTTQDIAETNTVTQTIFALPFSLIIIILISAAVWFIFSYLRTKNSF